MTLSGVTVITLQEILTLFCAASKLIPLPPLPPLSSDSDPVTDMKPAAEEEEEEEEKE